MASSEQKFPDKFGRDYYQLLALQKAQLASWKKVLAPKFYQKLEDYCELINGPAEPYDKNSPIYRAGGLHCVPVGAELSNYLMELVNHE